MLMCPGQVAGSAPCSRSGLMRLHLRVAFPRSLCKLGAALKTPPWK